MRTISKVIALTSVLVLLMTIHGCGFQLRGADLGELDLDYGISGNVVGSSADPVSVEFLQLLKQSLSQAGASESRAGDVQIEITSLRREEIEGALNAQIRVSEKSIVFTLEYRVADVAGNDVVPDQRLQIERVFRIDRNNLLASHSEQKLLETELLRNLAGQLVRGLSVVMSGKAGANTAEI